jgi:archaellum biogenesis protein FlaJ (TadC family)
MEGNILEHGTRANSMEREFILTIRERKDTVNGNMESVLDGFNDYYISQKYSLDFYVNNLIFKKSL